MTVHQLSVFIENKSGTLVKVLQLLKQENIQLIASTIADTADYGICRIICSQPEKAYKVLKEAGVAVSLCEVFAIELDDRPGKAADAIEISPARASASPTCTPSCSTARESSSSVRTMPRKQPTSSPPTV